MEILLGSTSGGCGVDKGDNVYKVFKTVPGTLCVLATTNMANTNTLRNVGREKCL